MTTTTWQVTLLSNGEDVILPIPQELMDLQGWKEGDNLEFINDENGTWKLQKL